MGGQHLLRAAFGETTRYLCTYNHFMLYQSGEQQLHPTRTGAQPDPITKAQPQATQSWTALTLDSRLSSLLFFL